MLRPPPTVFLKGYVNRHLLKNNFNLEINFFFNFVTFKPLLTNSIKSPFYLGGRLYVGWILFHAVSVSPDINITLTLRKKTLEPYLACLE